MPRGGALLLGGVVLAAAVVFASRPLGVAGLGLLLAALIARALVAGASRPVDVQVTIEPDPATEGDCVRLRIDARRASRFSLGPAAVTGTLVGVGRFDCRLRRRGGRLIGDVDLGRLPRGRFDGADVRFELRDPLGLETRTQPLATPLTALVYPRLVELGTLFDDAGRAPGEGRRFLLRHPTGFDFQSVREYEQGESLRRVHWPTTARCGQLMVKELEDSPRESLAVVLDCDPAGAAGVQPDSSFDAAVRAAGSILRAHLARGRRAVLVATNEGAEPVTALLESELRPVLSALAGVGADASRDLARFLDHPPASVERAVELVVVTSMQSHAAANALLRVAARRAVAVVWVDAPSYVGRPTKAVPAILQVQAAGVPVAVLRRGDDLAAALAAPRREAVARG